MSDRQDPDSWLVGANKGWRQRAEAEKIRADSAERWAHGERTRHLRMRAAARDWRSATVLGWALLFWDGGTDRWHWPSWSVFPVVLGFQAVNTLVYAWQVRRARGQWSWKESSR